MTYLAWSLAGIAHFYLLATGRYAYGDHVTDPLAFVLRARTVQR